MTRRGPLSLVLASTVLLLASCGETPTESGGAEGLSAATAAPINPPGTWTIQADLPNRFVWRYELAAGVVTNASQQSTVYVLGGRFNQTPTNPPATTILAFDVVTDQWTTKAARFTGAATNGIGKIGSLLLISGGRSMSGDPSLWTDVSRTLFAYNWALDRVVRKANMPRATARGITGVINSKLYVLAGQCSGETLCRDFYRYDPATNAWTTLPPAPHSHRNGAGAVLGGKFYAAGGGASPYRSFDVYDPATNKWSTPGLLPPSRQFAFGTNEGGLFYVVGIEGGDREAVPFGGDRTTVAYDPLAKSWKTGLSPYPGPLGEGGQFLLHPAAAVTVFLNGDPYILALGSGHLYTDNTVKPAGTIDPGPPYIYTP